LDLPSLSIVGASGPFRSNASTELYNPTNSSPPFFQVFQPSFVTDVLGDAPSFHLIAANDSFAFAHEAGVYNPGTDEFFFSDFAGGPLSMNGWDKNGAISKISIQRAEEALAADPSVTDVNLELDEALQMTNGGTGPYQGEILFVGSGRRADLPSSLVKMNPNPPYEITVLVDNFFGRQFNSLNDVKVHPTSGNIFFTDPPYGYLNGFRPAPLLPYQVYRLDPITHSVRVVEDSTVHPNGLAFSPDGKTAYIADTGSRRGFLGVNQTLPATIYAFDVDEKTESFKNRRVFAYIDMKIPDGLHVDAQGYVYAGTGDGVQVVFDTTGTLIGKFFLGVTSANFGWAGPGRLIIMAETKVYLVRIKSD
ncbi:D-lactonohydrolase-like protein, partial [Cylindrobasidium torrendii FP15055 ss-10]